MEIGDKETQSQVIKILTLAVCIPACILVQVTIYRRLRIARDNHLYQSDAYVISTNPKPTIYLSLYENTGPGTLHVETNLTPCFQNPMITRN